MQAVRGYRVEAVLHEGRKTVVYRARSEASGERVIVKALRAERPSAREVAAARREHGILQRLTSAHVIGVLGLLDLDNGPALLLEDFGARGLHEHLGGEPLPLDAFWPLAIALAQGLADIHAAHIIHKDIKPANLVFHADSGQIKFIDFNISSLIPREAQPARAPELMEGTLSYLAPEQTGRLNRAVDYRADFYALGATFYEMLTGRPPFEASDALELVHSHLARAPVPPGQVRPGLPPSLSAIVVKLLSKTPEERYQSALGLRADLVACREHGEVDPGQRDVPQTLQLSQRLYGREAEVERLVGAFERAAAGRVEVALVTGPAGAGKSALVREVQRSIARRRGNFLEGKFDQYRRDIPYSALLGAFAGLLRQVLGQSEARVAATRGRLGAALGDDARLLAEVLPELELLMGPMAPLSPLGPSEARARFQRAMLAFVGVVASPEQPLVLFVDDLQWGDDASLSVLELLVAEPEGKSLLLIGAYRPGEIEPGSAQAAAIEALRSRPGAERIEPGPLSSRDLERLCEDSLRERPGRTRSLASLLEAKTGGNPFFVHEFLQALYHEGLLELDAAAGAWRWDDERIRSHAITENVAELLAARLRRLPEEARAAVAAAACLGATFGLGLLAAARQEPLARSARALWPAVEQGLVAPVDEGYRLLLAHDELGPDAPEAQAAFRFAHDRVQQAAYALLDEGERAALHARAGRHLLAHAGAGGLDELLFEVVDHLDRGEALLDRPERDRLASLHLAAGRRAAASGAFGPSAAYLASGAALLSPGGYERDFDLAFALDLELARSSFLARRYGDAEALFEALAERARTPLERARVRAVQLPLRQMVGKLGEVLDLGTEALSLLGLGLSPSPTAAEAEAGCAAAEALLAGRSMDELLALPDATDATTRTALDLLVNLGAAAFILRTQRPGLWPLLVARVVALTIERGSSPCAVYGYCSYGVLLGARGDYARAYDFGELGLKLADRYDDRTFQCLASYIHGAFLMVWRRPLARCIALLERAERLGIESGNVPYAAFSRSSMSRLSLSTGVALDECERVEQVRLDQATKLQGPDYARQHLVRRQWARALLGKTRAPTALGDEQLDEQTLAHELRSAAAKTALHSYLLGKSVLHLLWGEGAAAQRLADEAAAVAPLFLGLFDSAEQHFFGALAAAAAHASAPAGQQPSLLARLAEAREALGRWAAHCAESFSPRLWLVEAEEARLLGRDRLAMARYDQAIAAARRGRFVHLEALGSELAARFYLDAGAERAARPYLASAYQAYLAWGAAPKASALAQAYPFARASTAPPSSTSASLQPTATSSSIPLQLDLEAILKAARAISGEIVLDRLTERLVAIVLQSAGAQRGVLLLADGPRLIACAEATADGLASTSQAIPLDEHPALAASVIQYVARACEPLVLHDAALPGPFASDPYITSARPRSLLCAPLLHQGSLAGVIYLENNRAPGSFTPARLEVVRLLASQAAIALDNARLYARLEDHTASLERTVDERTRELRDTLAKVVESQARLSDELREAAEHVRSLLPPPLSSPSIALDWRFLPSAELGGDGLGYLVLDRDRTAFYVLDVCGHGVSSALLSISALSALRSGSLRGVELADPSAVLSALNATFVSALHSGLYFTIWYGVHDARRGELSFASAGHPAALLFEPGALAPVELSTPSTLIGLVDDGAFITERRAVAPASSLFVFSDGAYEIAQQDGTLLRYEAFVRELSRDPSPTGHTLDRMLAFARAVRGADTLDDDISWLSVRL